MDKLGLFYMTSTKTLDEYIHQLEKKKVVACGPRFPCIIFKISYPKSLLHENKDSFNGSRRFISGRGDFTMGEL